MSDLIDTTEMYLRTILELEEEHVVPMRARITERLGHSGPTVSQTIARMERDGLVNVSENRQLEFTEAGRKKATAVLRKHRIAERLLADVIGLEWEFVHDEACRWEHVMSEMVERKVLSMLNYPTESPYGNPIPGLDELGLPAALPFRVGVLSLHEFLSDQDALHNSDSPREVVIKRLAEPVQSDAETLALFRRSGVYPNARASITASGKNVVLHVHGNDAPLELTSEATLHIFVAE